MSQLASHSSLPSTRTFAIETDPHHLEEILTLYLHRSEWTPIREYVANAHDACLGNANPMIRIWANRKESTIQIQDNGRGMTETVIRKAFTAIGGHLQAGDNRPVGRFGLGVLSAFIIAERLVAETRSADEPHGWRIEWGRRTGQFRLTPIKREEVGTLATLHIDAEHREMIRDKDIAEYLQRDLGMFVTPIYVGERSNRPVNRHCEWLRQQQANPLPRLLPLGQAREVMELFGAPNMLAVYGTFSPDGPSLMLGIPDREQTYESLQGHRTWFFCQGILVEKSVEKYFPENLAFVSGLIDHPRFKMQVTREGLIQEHEFRDTKEQVSQHIIEFLELLAQQAPATMERVLTTHRTMLLVQASQDKRLVTLFRNHYPFMTTDGQLRWEEIVARCTPGEKVVHVLSESNPQLHVQDMARARKKILVITTAVEEELLRDIAKGEDVRIAEAAQLMHNAGRQESIAPPFQQLAGRLTLPLSRHGIPRLKPTGQLEVDAGPVILEVQGADDGKFICIAGMFLNVRHPLIEALAVRCDQLSAEQLQRAADTLFYIAILNQRSTFEQAAMAAAGHIATHLAHALAQEINMPANKLATQGRAKCFVSMPRTPAFSVVYQAISQVCADRPYGWQVVCSDESKKSDILGSTLLQVASCRRFVADLSGRDHDVLFELGMMLQADREGTILLCDRETFPHIMPKLRGTACLVYDARLRSDPVAMRSWFAAEIANHTRFTAMQGDLNSLPSTGA